ncbi:MAG: cytochrome c oxidase subunit III [Acidobacteria bacterium OLB17]|nr:MAG: cytochrome c oxidase subunit III [Acidobacteria bacterium OLB17]MCZ2392049.1 cytochrome c oxidase subunit 3 [Acidobacteriota bacterium]
MKVGVADTLDEVVDEKRRKRPGLTSSGPGGGDPRGPKGNGGGGSGPDGGDDDRKRFDDATRPNAAKTRMLTYFLLMVVVMTFGGMISAYLVLKTNGSTEWKPFDLPIQVWVSTAIIILSSVAYIVAERALMAEEHLKAKKWLLIATVLGGCFISSQLVLWLELISWGVYAYGNPYAGFFYILTALHALHVLGGIVAMSSIVLRAWNPPISEFEVERRKTIGQVVGWYWHMMGGLWIVIVGLLGFWA